MSFPQYPSYKDSGVEWLGEVPTHWGVKRLKHVCHVFPSNVDKRSYDDETPVKLCNYTDVYYNEVITAGMDFMAASASVDQIEKFSLRAGDTIITKDSETADDIAIAAFVPEDLPGVVCGYHLSMVRPESDTCGAFVKRLFDSNYAKSCFAVLANGLTRVGLGQYELDNVELAFPPLAEQTAIAEFLDRETGKIDELVADQRRLMELLKEKRQAVISHAVTRGLNPAAPLKPSGIEWLGDVPAHWEVLNVKRLSSFITSGPRGWSERVGDDGCLFIQSGDLNDRLEIKFETAKRVSVAEDAETTRTRLMDGDVVVCITGAKTGNVAVAELVPEPAYVNQHLCLIRPTADVLPKFLGVLLKSSVGQTYFDFSQYGLKQGLSLENIKEAPVLVPPVAEQEAIVAHMEVELGKFDTLTAEAQRAIDLLQERRTALISAAVTGQIDVRGEV
jgi:type I restriction enzyme S subunit